MLFVFWGFVVCVNSVVIDDVCVFCDCSLCVLIVVCCNVVGGDLFVVLFADYLVLLQVSATFSFACDLVFVWVSGCLCSCKWLGFWLLLYLVLLVVWWLLVWLFVVGFGLIIGL